MGFAEDERKKALEELKEKGAVQEQKKARNKKIIFVLGAVALVGLTAVGYDVFQRYTTEDFYSDEPETRQKLVEEWTANGFILRLEPAERVCEVDEARWSRYDEDTKRDITLTIALYCQDKAAGETLEVMIRSDGTKRDLAKLLDTDLEIY